MTKRRIIGVDLDGTFCSDRYESGGVLKCVPLPGALEAIKELRLHHKVVFFTHRSEETRDDTVAMLEKYGVEYDGIIFGKPHFDIYIGNEARRFLSWKQVMEEI